MTSCRQIQDTLLTEYIDNQTSAANRADINQHLACCAACRVLLKSVQQNETTLRAASAVTPPEELWTNIRARIEASSEPSLWRNLVYYLFGAPQRTAWTALASAVIILGAGIGLFSSSQRAGTESNADSTLMAMIEDADPITASDDIDLNTDTEYLLDVVSST